MKIDPTFVSQVFHPDPQATSVLLSQLASQLAERGLHPVVYTGHLAAGPGAKTPASEFWQGVNIRRGGLRIDGKKNLAARGLAYLGYSVWLKWTLLLRTPANSHLIVLTNPPFAPLLVWLCSWWRGWTYDVFLHDVYPDGLVALGQMSPRGLLTRLWTAANRRAYSRARRILVLGRDMAELCRDRYGVEAGKISVVPSWSPVDFPTRPAAEETRLWRRLGFHRQFVVQYSGNMGLWHDLRSIVEAAEILGDEPTVHFLLIGDGRRRAEAEQLAGRLELRNITWLPFQPQAELGDSLACCHAAVVSQRAGLEGVAVPSKLYGILASGRAVLAPVPANSETARVVRERECGLVISPGDAAALAAAIGQMRDDPAATGRMGRQAAEAGSTQYTLAAMADMFESVILKKSRSHSGSVIGRAMKGIFPFAWVAGFTALALFSIRDVRLCQWFTVLPAAWGLGMALGTRTGRARRYFTTVTILAGGYAVLISTTWWLAGVTPDWAYFTAVGPFLLAGMLAPAAGLEIGPISAGKWKWIWLGLFLGTGMVIEANNLRLIDYHRLQVGFFHPSREIWTEKYYTYWLLLLVWAVVAFFSWRRKVDRLVILGLLGLTAMLIWCSGRSVRSLGILASGVAVYSLLNTVALSPRQLKVGLALLVLWWGAAPWLFKSFDLSQVDPRVGERTLIYGATHDLILQRPWTGHGFGQAATLTHPLLPTRFQHYLPGGHPHNLALLFWVEYGVAGALFLCVVTWYLFRRVIDCASGRGSWPALAALIVSFVAMVSFSWDIWEYSIILFYAAFAALVVLILNLDDERAADRWKPDEAGPTPRELRKP